MTGWDWRPFAIMAVLCAGMGVLVCVMIGDRPSLGAAAGLLLFAFIMAMGFLALAVSSGWKPNRK